ASLPARFPAAPSPRGSPTPQRVPPTSTAAQPRRMPLLSPRSFLPDRSHRRHLHPATGLELTAADDRPGRAMITESPSAGCIDTGPVIARVDEHVQRDDQVEAAAGSGEDLPDVLQHLIGLLLGVALDHQSRARVDRQLTAHVHQSVTYHGLA